MKTRMLKFVFVVLLPFCAYATNITFTSSGSIVEGDVYNAVYLQNDGTVVNMSGGQIGGGDTFSGLQIYERTIFNMSGGQILYHSSINMERLSTINISGGTIATGQFVVYDSAVFDVSGGNITVDTLKTYFNSVVNVTGGNVSVDVADIMGTLNLYGGSFIVNNSYASLSSGSQINIHYSDFCYTPNSNPLYHDGVLTGHLLDGSEFRFGGLDDFIYSSFNLIPEPATVFLLSIGGLFLQKKYRG